MINFMSGCNLLHASVTSGLFFLVFLLRKKTLLSRWYFSDFVLFLFFFSCILHQQWVVSSLLSGHQPQLSSQYTQERSSWSRTCAGSPSRSQCAKHSTCSHHSSYKNKQRPVEERGPTGKLTFKKPFTLTLCLSVFPPYLVALVCFKCLFSWFLLLCSNLLIVQLAFKHNLHTPDGLFRLQWIFLQHEAHDVSVYTWHMCLWHSWQVYECSSTNSLAPCIKQCQLPLGQRGDGNISSQHLCLSVPTPILSWDQSLLSLRVKTGSSPTQPSAVKMILSPITPLHTLKLHRGSERKWESCLLW